MMRKKLIELGLIEECEKRLLDICDHYFYTKIFEFHQTMRMIHFINDVFYIKPDFPWEKIS